MSTTDDTRDDESRAVESLDESFIEPGPRRSTYTPPPKPNVAAAAAAVGADPETIVAEAAAAAAVDSSTDDVPAPRAEGVQSSYVVPQAFAPRAPSPETLAASPSAPLTQIPVWGGFSEPIQPDDLDRALPDQDPGDTAASGEDFEAQHTDTSEQDALAVDEPTEQLPQEPPVFVEPAAEWQSPAEQPSPSWDDLPVVDSEPDQPESVDDTAAPEVDSLQSFLTMSTDPAAAPTVYALDDVPLIDDGPPPLYFAAPAASEPGPTGSSDPEPTLSSVPEPTVSSVPEPAADEESDEPVAPPAPDEWPAPVDESSEASEVSDAPEAANPVYDISEPAAPSPFGDPELDSTTPPPSFGAGQLPPPPFTSEQPLSSEPLPSPFSGEQPPPPFADEQLPPPPRPGEQLPPPPAPGGYDPTGYDENTYVMPPFVEPLFGGSPVDEGTPATDGGLGHSFADIHPADGFSAQVYDVSAAAPDPSESTTDQPVSGPFAMPAAAPATFIDPGTTVPSLSDLPGPGMPPPSFDSPEAQAAFLANHAAPAGRPWIPERRSMSDDDLAAALTEVASTPSQRLDAMEELERQMHLREVEAREYSDWENSMLSVGTPEAIAAVEQVRPKFEDIVPATTSIPIITPEIAAAYEAERRELSQRAPAAPEDTDHDEAPSFAPAAPEVPEPTAEAPSAWMPPPPSAPSMFAQSYASVASATGSDLPEGAAPADAATASTESSEAETASPSISFDDLFGETSSRASALASERAAAEQAAAGPADLPAPPVAQAAPASPVEPVFEPFADPFFGRTAAALATSPAAAAPADPQSPVTAPTQAGAAAEPVGDAPASAEQQPFAWIIDPSQAPAAPPVDVDPAVTTEPETERGPSGVPPVTPPPLVEPPAYTGAFEFTSPSSSSSASSAPTPEPEELPAAASVPADAPEPAASSGHSEPPTGLAFATAAAAVAPEPLSDVTISSDPPSGSFASILGDSNVDFQRPVEHVETTERDASLDLPDVAPQVEPTFSSVVLLPVAESQPEVAEAAAAAPRTRAAREVPAFVPEQTGAEPTPTDRRVGRAARQFWLWFAANSSVISLAFGGILFSLGMSLRQAIIATLTGVVLSFIPLGLGTLAGKRSGQPTMIVSRATFGVRGNIVPAVISLVSRVFWGATLLWVLAASVAASLVALGATAGMTQPQLVILGLAIAFVLALVVAFFGYGLLARFQLVVSIVSALLVAGLIGLTVQYVDISAALTVPDGPLALVLTGAVLVFSFVGLVWANSSSDLARYQRPGSSSGGSMLWATFGTTLPTFALISYGALLAASDPQIASGLLTDPLVTIGGLLPGWYLVPLVVATALSLLSGVVISIYSGGFALQAVGLRVKRQWSVVIVGVMLVVIAWVLSTLVGDLTLVFRDLATTLAVPVAAWAGIFAAETMIRNRAYDSPSLLAAGGIYPAVRVANLVGLFVISAVAYALTTASVGWLDWQGYGLALVGIPLDSDLAASDFGVLVALLLGILLPLVTGVSAIRRQESLMSAGTGAVAFAPAQSVRDDVPAPVVQPAVAAAVPVPVEPSEVELAPTQLIEVDEANATADSPPATDWGYSPSNFLSDTDTVSGLWAAADPSATPAEAPAAPQVDQPAESDATPGAPAPTPLPNYPSTPPTPPVSPTPPN